MIPPSDKNHMPFEHGWLYHNSGTLVLALMVFLVNFVFNDMQSNDTQLNAEVKNLNIQVAELRAVITPVINSFNQVNQKRYTIDDAARDQARWQQQLDEMKNQMRENQTTMQQINDRLFRVEAQF
ncbi:hypothetical protein [Alteromonas sp. C1M14]|uniref:hypothetical protein n=1 Tax=Alteromonas sp. C1M14 TaxID=2841567 RepID=UPI001C08A86D|nr:hypothetical protein [Alteromonas sp. C1M14]MBU2978996.1 hypothetical protein [Alteromonas sp. C1M14]